MSDAPIGTQYSCSHGIRGHTLFDVMRLTWRNATEPRDPVRVFGPRAGHQVLSNDVRPRDVTRLLSWSLMRRRM